MDFKKNTMEYLFCVEKQAEEILVDKSEIIALDKKRNDNRMAIRELLNSKTPYNKTWIAVGPILVKVTNDKAKEMLQEDQLTIDGRINNLRSELKIKVNKLRDMEYNEPVKGLFLNPLTKKEMSAMNQVLGGHA
ncbi:p53 and DNA damage-regulated protein 1 isoform X2 [Adelges cooleyi]|uniref:p53 and DNA damage-regulated protein 1 isoform X2 n=1 Tax=Adelges cooleyi TaxID=133065 RepID=UPI00217FD2FB|nr:p53 and DNA damage-regulated protein 1 isoform X2 [Adelges cooleyi]XP_050441824.1 p53 and DNA damage-regulated protein 1 isoform X2 [Adelges cooleyi]